MRTVGWGNAASTSCDRWMVSANRASRRSAENLIGMEWLIIHKFMCAFLTSTHSQRHFACTKWFYGYCSAPAALPKHSLIVSTFFSPRIFSFSPSAFASTVRRENVFVDANSIQMCRSRRLGGSIEFTILKNIIEIFGQPQMDGIM